MKMFPFECGRFLLCDPLYTGEVYIDVDTCMMQIQPTLQQMHLHVHVDVVYIAVDACTCRIVDVVYIALDACTCTCRCGLHSSRCMYMYVAVLYIAVDACTYEHVRQSTLQQMHVHVNVVNIAVDACTCRCSLYTFVVVERMYKLYK